MVFFPLVGLTHSTPPDAAGESCRFCFCGFFGINAIGKGFTKVRYQCAGEPRRPVSIEKLDYGKTSIIKSLFLVVVTVCTGKVESKSETEWIARMTAVHVLENWTDEK